MKVFPDKIKFYIKKSGMTYKTVCQRTNISRTTLYEWCSGAKTPTETNLRNLATVISAPINKISDLPSESLISEKSLSTTGTSWLNTFTRSHSDQSKEFIQLIENAKKMEKRLNELSLVFQGIMTTTDSILYIKDTNSKYVIVSKEFLENLSLPADFSVTGKTDFDFFSEKEAKKNELEDKEIIKYEKKIIKVEEFIPGTRKRKWGIKTKLPILDANNRIQGMLGKFLDITDKKKHEQLNEILDKKINEFSEVFSVFNINTGECYYTNANPENPEHSYLIPERYNTKDIMDRISIIHPEDRKHIISFHKSKIWPEKFEFRINSTSDNFRWIAASYKTVEYLGHKCISALYRDVTDTKRVDKIKDLLDCSVDLADDLISIVDKNNKSFVYVNNKFTEVFGVSKDFLYSKGLNYIVDNFIHEDSREQFIRSYSMLNNSIKKIYKLIAKNDKIMWVETNSKIISYNNRECIITVSRDISDLVYLMEQHSLLLEMADQTEDTIIWVGRMINNKVKSIHATNNLLKLTGSSMQEISTSHFTKTSLFKLSQFFRKKANYGKILLNIKCKDKQIRSFETQIYRKITENHKLLICAILKLINNEK